MKGMILTSGIFACCLVSALGCANTRTEPEIDIAVGESWGEPEVFHYAAVTETTQLRFTRSDATLIITKAECPDCQEITSADVDEYSNDASGETALLVFHSAGPAMLRLRSSPKDVAIRTFQMHANGFAYEMQLGVSGSVPNSVGLQLEREFIKMFTEFVP